MSHLVSWSDESREALLRDSLLGKLIRKMTPPQIRVGGDPFTLLVEAIVGQQLTGKAADTIFGRLVGIVGDIAPHSFAKHDVASLRSAGLSGAKAQTIIGLAAAARDGLDFSAIGGMPDDEIHSRLTSLRGIGPWTVEMFLIFALGRPDVMSPGDLGLRKGLRVVYGLDDLPKPKACPELFERWRPYRSAASWYLWRIAEGD